jgi:hypothetical protein
MAGVPRGRQRCATVAGRVAPAAAQRAHQAHRGLALCGLHLQQRALLAQRGTAQQQRVVGRAQALRLQRRGAFGIARGLGQCPLAQQRLRRPACAAWPAGRRPRARPAAHVRGVRHRPGRSRRRPGRARPGCGRHPAAAAPAAAPGPGCAPNCAATGRGRRTPARHARSASAPGTRRRAPARHAAVRPAGTGSAAATSARRCSIWLGRPAGTGGTPGQAGGGAVELRGTRLAEQCGQRVAGQRQAAVELQQVGLVGLHVLAQLQPGLHGHQAGALAAVGQRQQFAAPLHGLLQQRAFALQGMPRKVACASSACSDRRACASSSCWPCRSSAAACSLRVARCSQSRSHCSARPASNRLPRVARGIDARAQFARARQPWRTAAAGPRRRPPAARPRPGPRGPPPAAAPGLPVAASTIRRSSKGSSNTRHQPSAGSGVDGVERDGCTLAKGLGRGQRPPVPQAAR